MEFDCFDSWALPFHLLVIVFNIEKCFITKKHQLHRLSHVVRKSVFGVSDQVRHKLGCTATVFSFLLLSYTPPVKGRDNL